MSWALIDKSLVLQSVLYFAVTGTGLATVISAILSRNSSGGLCILYGQSSCHNTNHSGHTSPISQSSSNESSHFSPSPNGNKTTTAQSIISSTSSGISEILIQVIGGRVSVCDFVVGANIVVCVLYAIINGFYHAYSARKSAYQIRVGYQMWTRTLAFSSCLAIMLVMSSACMITVGLSVWCKSLFEEFRQCGVQMERCSDSQYQSNAWHWVTGDAAGYENDPQNNNSSSSSSGGGSRGGGSSSNSSSAVSKLNMGYYHNLMEITEINFYLYKYQVNLYQVNRGQQRITFVKSLCHLLNITTFQLLQSVKDLVLLRSMIARIRHEKEEEFHK
ncbi:hypothetical protein HELRODRAFT_192199 [Helobdella robusta]|uniref:Transmembrane protein n=1 Tax=Helobdella robusta TaxID=6412 RepID=T1FTP3_HELRO|nr:hypothetical protein HELRODRAFT_192199 [Helobdella robusta]ESO01599.1 hypothetical protein HELRODRAFT_192199 [Helobdella robusta]